MEQKIMKHYYFSHAKINSYCIIIYHHLFHGGYTIYIINRIYCLRRCIINPHRLLKLMRAFFQDNKSNIMDIGRRHLVINHH